MVDIIVGAHILNKAGETGVITAFDGTYLTVEFPTRTVKFLNDAFDQGYLRYEDAELQSTALKAIEQAKQEAEQQAEEARLAAERKREAETARLAADPTRRSVAASRTVKTKPPVLLIDPAPVYLSSVAKDDRQLVQDIFDECDKDTQTLYASFQPIMQYPKLTSHSRSKYCVGFLSKYKDTYVFRVFSRNDVYKNRMRTGVTILESNTAEVLRVLQVNGRLYHFSKNISVSLGYYNNSIGHSKWRGSDMGTQVFLNEVICNCDCGYLNGHITDQKANIQAFMYIHLLFHALKDNKVEIAFKNKAFTSAYGIKDIDQYLAAFSPKQIDFASKNNVLHALPFIKQFGVSDVALLRDLADVMQKSHYGRSVHDLLLDLFTRLGQDPSDLDKRIMNFVKRVEHFNAAIYYDYLSELSRQPAIGLTVQDLFDRNYIVRHDELLRERLEHSERFCSEEEKKIREEYVQVAKELSWIDREENGHFIIVPKTVKEFEIEGAGQHNCVYALGYYRHVIKQRSIIVFLRKEKSVPYVTIEYDYQTFAVRQALGKFNQRIDPQLYQYVVNLGKQLYYERHTQL